MKVPRNPSGSNLISYLLSIGYRKVRQTGSHVRLEIDLDQGTHAITIPLHDPLKVGTLNTIVKEVAEKTGWNWSDIMGDL
jgi:predicted RNA binding protein YcfA (HicA-like mRNA interferase family)